MIERRRREVELLRRKHGQVDHGPQFDWVIVRGVPLPQGYNRAATDVLIIMGPGYPNTPPDNFYVTPGLRLANGSPPSNSSPGSFSHEGTSWDMFSWHHEAGWNPATDPEDGSNLLGFMREVERRLAEVN